MEQRELSRGKVNGGAVDGCSLLVQIQLQAIITKQMPSQTGLYDIHDVIAYLLAFRDNVVVECAESIGILMGVDAYGNRAT